MAFIKVKNNQKYLKAIIFGEAGTGKTTLAERLAIGLCENSKTKKVFVLDTEGGIDFFAERFAEHGIECFATDVKINTTKVFAEHLNEAISLKPDVILVDSITHVGELYEQEYVNSKPAKDSIFHWGTAKRVWNLEVINQLKDAKCHVIICGRETTGMNIEKKEVNGLTKTKIDYSNPTKVRSGLGITYELNLLLNTETATVNGKQVRIARVLKDRAHKIDGEEFVNTTFDDIKPHLEGLAKDSELYLTLKSKIEACEDMEGLEILKSELSKIKHELSQTEIGELATIFKSKQKELIK